MPRQGAEPSLWIAVGGYNSWCRAGLFPSLCDPGASSLAGHYVTDGGRGGVVVGAGVGGWGYLSCSSLPSGLAHLQPNNRVASSVLPRGEAEAALLCTQPMKVRASSLTLVTPELALSLAVGSNKLSLTHTTTWQMGAGSALLTSCPQGWINRIPVQTMPVERGGAIFLECRGEALP